MSASQDAQPGKDEGGAPPRRSAGASRRLRAVRGRSQGCRATWPLLAVVGLLVGEVGGSESDSCQAAPAKLKVMEEASVSFCPKPSTFTALYEPADTASYSARFASVNAGSFELYVGGGAINLGFARMLHKVGHRVDDYETMHRTLYNRVMSQPKEFRTERGWRLVDWPSAMTPSPDDAAAPAPAPSRPIPGVASASVLLSTLPDRFNAFGTLAGTVFVDVFEADMRPEANANNHAMVYVVGPEGSLATDSQDFLDACEYTGENIAQALTEHNAAHKSEPLDMVRMCLVSGGIFRHGETSKQDVAKAFIKGLSKQIVPEKTPKIEFAYDEDVFKTAYLALKAEVEAPAALDQ